MIKPRTKILCTTVTLGLGGLVLGVSWGRTKDPVQRYEYFSGRLLEKKAVGKETALLSFEVPDGTRAHFSPTLSHFFAVDNGNVYRPYTPIFSSSNKFSLLIKNYGKTGYMSSHIHSLKKGDELSFFGPQRVLDFEIESSENDSRSLVVKNTVNDQNYRCKELVLLSTGTGIAPMLQISSSLSKSVQIHLIHFARSPEEAPVLDQLTEMATSNDFSFSYKVICKHQPSSKAGSYVRGEINHQVIEREISLLFGNELTDIGIIVCGNDRFLSRLCGPGHEDGKIKEQPHLNGILSAIGFLNDQVFRI